MTTTKKREGQSQKKYLWFGFGNYGGQPVQQKSIYGSGLETMAGNRSSKLAGEL